MTIIDRMKFNLVEILMAIFVIAIGVTGIMGLMPVGMNAARDARAENYANFAVNQFIAWLKFSARSNVAWESGTSGVIYNLLDARISHANDATSVSTNIEQKNGNFDKVTSGVIDNLYQYKEASPSGMNYQLFKIVQQSPDAGIDDFNGIIRMWRLPIDEHVMVSTRSGNAATAQVTNGSGLLKLARIVIEISWPTNYPYVQRKKKMFSIDLYNPN